jgi:predicted GNAT superfamily acetyltransferase
MTEVQVSYLGIYQYLRELKTAEEELEKRRANPWGGPKERSIREKLIRTVGAYTVLTLAKMQVFERGDAESVSAELAIAPFECGEVEEESLEVTVKANYAFRETIEAEMGRTYALMDKHFGSLTLLT